MKKFILTLMLMMPLCGSGEFDRVSFPKLFADAQMPLYACRMEIESHEDRAGLFQPVVLIFAGEPKYREGNYYQLDLIKAMTFSEFIEELDRERD
jgi:hypothetical protein